MPFAFIHLIKLKGTGGDLRVRESCGFAMPQ